MSIIGKKNIRDSAGSFTQYTGSVSKQQIRYCFSNKKLQLSQLQLVLSPRPAHGRLNVQILCSASSLHFMLHASFSSIKIKFRASVTCKCIVFASILCCNFLLHTVFSGLKTGELRHFPASGKAASKLHT